MLSATDFGDENRLKQSPYGFVPFLRPTSKVFTWVRGCSRVLTHSHFVSILLFGKCWSFLNLLTPGLSLKLRWLEFFSLPAFLINHYFDLLKKKNIPKRPQTRKAKIKKSPEVRKIREIIVKPYRKPQKNDKKKHFPFFFQPVLPWRSGLDGCYNLNLRAARRSETYKEA